MRVYLISKPTLHREGLAEVLARRDGIELIGTAADAGSLPLSVIAARGAERTVIVLDASDVDIAEVAPPLARGFAGPVLAINVPVRERDVIACAEAGIACCLTPEASLDDLVAAIGSVARGEAPCSAWIAAVLTRRVATLAAERRVPADAAPVTLPTTAPAGLTVRELEVVDLVEQGLSNKEIASRLSIELPTVKNHVHRILEKLGVQRRGDAAAIVRGAQRMKTPEY